MDRKVSLCHWEHKHAHKRGGTPPALGLIFVFDAAVSTARTNEQFWAYEAGTSTSMVVEWSLILNGLASSSGTSKNSATDATSFEYHTVAVTVT